MAKSFLVSPGRAYLVIAGEGTKIVRANGTLIDTVPEGANNVSITVDTHEIIVMDNAAKIQQLYNGNSGSSGIMTAAEGEDAGSWKVEIVSTLPEVGSPGVIYMLRTNRTGTDRYDDYIWIAADNAYELLGRRPESTSVDLSGVAKTDVANTFTKDQRVNGTLTATSIDVTRLSCDQKADIGTADVSYLNYDTANGSYMTVSHVTILTSLHVDPQAAVDLPGLEWRDNLEGGRFITASYDVVLNALTVQNTANVSNVLTLGTGSIELDGRYDTIRVQDAVGGIAVDPSSIQILATDATLALKGGEMTMKVGAESRTVFSVAQTTAGKFLLNVSDGASLNGTISIPGTLNVNNLNVTGTVTGITGGGTTPTVDFSNGVTIMQILTADDIVADTVTATTLSAGSSLSVSEESVIYRHTDGAIYVHGDIVNATQVAATTFIPTNIQGATFTGPLVMTKDNALQVWNQGSMAEIRNGNITGFYYAQVDHCTVTHALSADSAKINRASITDTLTVKDLIVTGTTTGIPTGGGGEGSLPDSVPGDFTVDGRLNAGTLLLKNSTRPSPDVVLWVDTTTEGTPVFTLRNNSSDGDTTDMVHLKAKVIEADRFIVNGSDIDNPPLGLNGLTVMGHLTVPASRHKVFFQDEGSNPVLCTSATSSDTTQILALRPVFTSSQENGVILDTYGVQVSYINSISIETLEDIVENGGTVDISTGHMSKVWCLQLGSDHENTGNPVNVVSPLTCERSIIANGITCIGPLTADGITCIGRLITDSLTCIGTLETSELQAATAHVGAITCMGTLIATSITAGYAEVEGSLLVNDYPVLTEQSLIQETPVTHSTPGGTSDTLCRWAQIGSTHTMLEAGYLTEISLPGPSVQKLPTSATVTSFVLSLWYQADTAGSDIRLIGISSNVVTPSAGTNVANRWLFDNVEIKEEYLGHNLRLLCLPGTNTSTNWTWDAAATESNNFTCYIQGRYTTDNSDSDCLVTASNNGDKIYKTILAASMTVTKRERAGLLTQEQKTLLDWLAANKDALANLLASASSST